MQQHDELETWRRQWQAQGSVPPDLRARVARDIRRRRLSFIGSVAVTIVMGGGTTVWAVLSQRPGSPLVLVGVWVFIALTWTVAAALERRRGSWTPTTETTAAFLDFSIRSCRVRLQGMTAAAILYVAFMVFMLAWQYRAGTTEAAAGVWTFLASARMGVIGAITLTLAVAFVWRRRLLRRELEALVSLRQQLRA
jgi:hypothetical protein